MRKRKIAGKSEDERQKTEDRGQRAEDSVLFHCHSLSFRNFYSPGRSRVAGARFSRLLAYNSDMASFRPISPSSPPSQPNRLPLGGRILRNRPMTMRFDNRAVAAFRGDTLASALLANGAAVVGRSFKYHRARGVFSAGAEETNALVQVGEEGRGTPNTPATMTPVCDGLVAHSQNRFPSLRVDVGAVNQVFSPFLSAGFYYKTFVGPGKGTKFWMFCERFIRGAAGLGKASESSDPDSYDKVNSFCDVLVVGGGVAGLSAALAAGRRGARGFARRAAPGFRRGFAGECGKRGNRCVDGKCSRGTAGAFQC